MRRRMAQHDNPKFHSEKQHKGCTNGVDRWVRQTGGSCPYTRRKVMRTCRLHHAHLYPNGCKWSQLTDRQNKYVHHFSGNIPDKRHNMACHINKDLTPYNIFMLYFASVITLQYLDALGKGPSALSDVTESEMFVFGDYHPNGI
ncbi:hypothetical protein L798_13810 [Zootermopsis nevadensis]|uniref:Uncharacterized protein n=1 Tax=Zootermopsis nevadensis TaxID=136037 RepID=A0A067R3A3_ZOONE|nr:hypothetical protein L798_13810 [Zootermopsis nevadensis]